MRLHAASLLIASFTLTSAAHGQASSSFYQHKQVRMIIGHAVGGDYDLGGRLLAKYLGKYIPGNPVIVAQNMPGAASVVAANYLYNQASRDGTVFGGFSRPLVTQAILGAVNIQGDFRRFVWVGGTAAPSPRVCAVWHSKAVKTTDDLFKRELIVAGTGPGSGPSMVPLILNEVIQTKFRLVEGYNGHPQAYLAMERQEVEGVCLSLGLYVPFDEKVKSGEIRLLLHSAESLPGFPNVPSVYDYTKSPEQRDILRFVFASEEFVRPYVLPPEVPEDRVAIIRRAFAEALKDPELIADAGRSSLDMTYQPPQKFTKLVDELYSASPTLIARVKKLVEDLEKAK